MKQWSTLKKLIWLRAMSAVKEYSGAVVTFFTNAVKPLKALIINLPPVQDLHGYDNPWPAGGGKNKLEINSAIAGTYNQCTFIVADDGTIRVSGTPTQQTRRTITTQTFSGMGTLILSGTIPTGIRVFCRRVGGGSTTYPTLSSGTTLDTDTYTFDQLVLEVNTTFDGTAVDLRFQIESGSSPTSWTPYANICPITGRTGANVYRTGKNLLNIADAEIGTAWNGDSNSAMARLVIPVKPNTDYVLSMNGTMSVDGVYSTISTVIPSPTTPTSVAFPKSINSGDNTYLTLGLNKSAIAQSDVEALKLQLELGSTATAYESYQGTTYPVTWQTEAGTVYGGTLDVTTGKLTVTMASVDMGTLSWQKSTSAGHERIWNGGIKTVVKKPDTNNMKANIVCSIFDADTANNTYSHTKDNTVSIGTDGVIYCYSSSIYDEPDVGTALSGVQLVYELATPVTYQLTPQEVKSLVGQNVVWSDAGEVTVRV